MSCYNLITPNYSWKKIILINIASVYTGLIIDKQIDGRMIVYFAAISHVALYIMTQQAHEYLSGYICGRATFILTCHESHHAILKYDIRYGSLIHYLYSFRIDLFHSQYNNYNASPATPPPPPPFTPPPPPSHFYGPTTPAPDPH